MSDTTEKKDEPVKQTGADLTISDLNAMKLIIDVASQRGAFKPNEMVLVGQTYQKLTAFLELAAQRPPQQEGGAANG